jgi:hypothetical protein
VPEDKSLGKETTTEQDEPKNLKAKFLGSLSLAAVAAGLLASAGVASSSPLKPTFEAAKQQAQAVAQQSKDKRPALLVVSPAVQQSALEAKHASHASHASHRSHSSHRSSAF